MGGNKREGDIKCFSSDGSFHPHPNPAKHSYESPVKGEGIDSSLPRLSAYGGMEGNTREGEAIVGTALQGESLSFDPEVSGPKGRMNPRGCPLSGSDRDTSLAKGGISARQVLSLHSRVSL